MKASTDFIIELNKLVDQYTKEVNETKAKGLLTESTAKTYLLHTSNFAKWCKGDFVPGARNK